MLILKIHINFYQIWAWSSVLKFLISTDIKRVYRSKLTVSWTPKNMDVILFINLYVTLLNFIIKILKRLLYSVFDGEISLNSWKTIRYNASRQLIDIMTSVFTNFSCNRNHTAFRFLLHVLTPFNYFCSMNGKFYHHHISPRQ